MTLLRGAWSGVHVRAVPAGVQGQRHALRAVLHGRAVQVARTKSELKLPRTQRLTLQYHEPLSNFAFKLDLQRYTMGVSIAASSAVAGAVPRGTAVQLDPVKLTLKAPKYKLLKLEHEIVLSSYAFKFNLRCYTAAARPASSPPCSSWSGGAGLVINPKSQP